HIMARVCSAFALELPLQVLFEYPTIAGLAARIAEAAGSPSESDATLSIAGSMDPTPPLSFTQQQLWLLDKLYPESRAYSMSGLLHFKGSLCKSALDKSITEI